MQAPSFAAVRERLSLHERHTRLRLPLVSLRNTDTEYERLWAGVKLRVKPVQGTRAFWHGCAGSSISPWDPKGPVTLLAVDDAMLAGTHRLPGRQAAADAMLAGTLAWPGRQADAVRAAGRHAWPGRQAAADAVLCAGANLQPCPEP